MFFEKKFLDYIDLMSIDLKDRFEPINQFLEIHKHTIVKMTGMSNYIAGIVIWACLYCASMIYIDDSIKRNC